MFRRLWRHRKCGELGRCGIVSYILQCSSKGRNNGRNATSGVGAIAVSASAVKHNAGRDAVFNATLNANIIKVSVSGFIVVLLVIVAR